MLELLWLALHTLRAAVSSRRDLALENLVLRHQVGVALRTNPRPRLRGPDRVLWVWRRPLAGRVAPAPPGGRPEMGDVVTWTNTGTEARTVGADDGRAFNSPVVNPGETYQQTFTRARRYPDHCSFHPWMTGTVTVGA